MKNKKSDNGHNGTVKVITNNLCFTFSWTITLACFCFVQHLQYCYVNLKLHILKKTHNLLFIYVFHIGEKYHDIFSHKQNSGDFSCSGALSPAETSMFSFFSV